VRARASSYLRRNAGSLEGETSESMHEKWRGSVYLIRPWEACVTTGYVEALMPYFDLTCIIIRRVLVFVNRTSLYTQLPVVKLDTVVNLPRGA